MLNVVIGMIVIGFTSLITIPAYIYGVFSCGFVLSHLWSWFIVPLGIPAITWVQGTGISIVISYLTHQIQLPKEFKLPENLIRKNVIMNKGLLADPKDFEDAVKNSTVKIEDQKLATYLTLFHPWLILLSGWLFHHFFM